MRVRPLIASLAAAATLFGLAGCSGSVSIGEKKVGTGELEKQVSSLVTKQLGKKPSAVDCPDRLAGKAKATTLCTVTVDGDKRTVRLTVTKVDDGKAAFDVAEVNADGSPIEDTTTTEPDAPTTTAAEDTPTTGADGVPTVAPAELERQITAELKTQVGREPDGLTCPDALEGTVGATTTCVLTDGADTYDVLVTARRVNGLDVNFDFKVADTPN